VFRHSLAREAASAIGGRVDRRAFVSRFAPGVEPPKRFEWTPLYFKELRVVGSNGFGVESVRGVSQHAMLHYFDFVGERDLISRR
jgi:hypothetical protein